MASRSPGMLYDVESFTDAVEIAYHKRHAAVRRLHITDDAFVLDVCPAEPEIEILIDKMVTKMQETLDLCRKATEKGSPFRIRQERIRRLKWQS